MRPITAKGGITGTDLPTVRGKGKLVMVMSGFKLYEDDVKRLDKLCRTLGMTRSEWIGWQINRSLGNE